MLGSVGLAFSTHPLTAAVSLGLAGLGHGVSWPAVNTLVSSLVPSQIRQRYFGINFTLLNLGIGIGGLIGGRVVDTLGFAETVPGPVSSGRPSGR